MALPEGYDTIVIAHRLNTVRGVDRIVVLQEGRIAEIGSRAELVACGGILREAGREPAGGFLTETAGSEAPAA